MSKCTCCLSPDFGLLLLLAWSSCCTRCAALHCENLPALQRTEHRQALRMSAQSHEAHLRSLVRNHHQEDGRMWPSAGRYSFRDKALTAQLEMNPILNEIYALCRLEDWHTCWAFCLWKTTTCFFVTMVSSSLTSFLCGRSTYNVVISPSSRWMYSCQSRAWAIIILTLSPRSYHNSLHW